MNIRDCLSGWENAALSRPRLSRRAPSGVGHGSGGLQDLVVGAEIDLLVEPARGDEVLDERRHVGLERVLRLPAEFSAPGLAETRFRRR